MTTHQRLLTHASRLAREHLRLKRLGDRSSTGPSAALKRFALEKYAQATALHGAQPNGTTSRVVRDPR